MKIAGVISVMKKLVLLPLAALAAGAHADVTGMLNLSPKTSTRLSVNISYLGRDMNVWGGPVKATFNSATFDAYCVDLKHWNTETDSYKVRVETTSTVNYGGRAAYLYNAFSTGVNTKAEGAALQLAIWDVITDNGDGFSKGDFKARGLSSEVVGLAHQYLNASSGKTSTANVFRALDHGKYGKENQDMMGPVPEPATMAALGVGVAAMIRRRRAAKK